jgi:hypothetical protein
MSTPDRAEINRRNAQNSTGPRTVEGKNRSRLTALKHGMTATLPVLPSEDAEAFRGRVDAWTDDLRPRSEIESYLVERAARASWQLERIERTNVARLTTNIQKAEAGEAQPGTEGDIAALGERLIRDPRGPLPLDSTRLYNPKTDPRTSWSGVADDPDRHSSRNHVSNGGSRFGHPSPERADDDPRKLDFAKRSQHDSRMPDFADRRDDRQPLPPRAASEAETCRQTLRTSLGEENDGASPRWKSRSDRGNLHDQMRTRRRGLVPSPPGC